MSAHKKAVVISNCQCLPLASALTTFSVDTTFDFFGVHVLAPDKKVDAIAEFVEKARTQYDFILSAPLSNEFISLAKDEITRTFTIPVITISNIYFSGYHPDLTYIGGLGKRLMGPLGDYHSKLCLYAFIRGVDVDVTERIFREEVYHDVGYFNEYNASLAELRTRDKSVDVAVSDILPQLLGRKYCFYSVNHPTSSLISEYSREILLHLERINLVRFAHLPVDPNMCADTLAGNCIFPIYPEIAAHHGIPEFGSYRFKPIGPRVNSLSLKDFIRLEYNAFSSVGANALAATHTGKSILATMSNVESIISLLPG